MIYDSFLYKFKCFHVLATIFLFVALPDVLSQPLNIPFNETDTYKKMIGERVFHGLIGIDRETPSCISCHAKYTGSEINWSPTAKEIISIIDTLSLDEFKIVINNTGEDFVSKSHKGYRLSDEHLEYLHHYLKNYKESDLGKPPKSYPKLIWFLILGVLMALALIDLIFTKIVKYKVIHILVIIAGISTHVSMAYNEASSLGRSLGYMPDQPVKFSHRVHAGDNKIECKYCHNNAEHGKSAGIPGPELCMNCHMIVRQGSRSGKHEIAKVVLSSEKGQDIEWIRVHNLPRPCVF